jgi:uncharacterized cupredoxin-like copper-binding protein
MPRNTSRSPQESPSDSTFAMMAPIVHDLVFEDGWQSGQVRPGDAITVELDPQTASSVAWCSVPGHRDAGMELEVVVRQGDDA